MNYSVGRKKGLAVAVLTAISIRLEDATMYPFRRILLSLVLVISVAATVAPAGAQITGVGSLTSELDEVWLRGETNLGLVSKPGDGTPGEEGVLDGDPWLVTQAQQFVNIKKESIISGSSRTVNGIQMSSSFVAPADTNVAIHVSAEAFVEGKGGASPDTINVGRDADSFMPKVVKRQAALVGLVGYGLSP
ncbi:MAG: hypothetical protein ACREGD_04965 [Candidatus Saccharimonadales bacterium]